MTSFLYHNDKDPLSTLMDYSLVWLPLMLMRVLQAVTSVSSGTSGSSGTNTSGSGATGRAQCAMQ